MLDLVGSIIITATFVGGVGLVLGAAPLRPEARTRAAVAIGAWAGLIVAASALDLFAPSAVPGVGLAAIATMGLLAAALTWRPALRDALLAVPLPLLVSLHAARFLGGMFLLLEAQGRLAGPFAGAAAWGDIAVAAAALPVALMIHRRTAGWRPAALTWNALGIADFAAALFLGLASAPGTAFRVFLAEPGTAAMGALPWSLVPGLLVPCFLLTHLLVALRLQREEHAATPQHGLGAGA